MAEIGYVWQQVAARIEQEIADGTLPPGAMLRGERAMAEEYGVAITTVRRAVRDLRDRGLLVTLPAKGTYVADHALPCAAMGGDALPRAASVDECAP
jgi:GntR family transcriptional regulator